MDIDNPCQYVFFVSNFLLSDVVVYIRFQVWLNDEMQLSYYGICYLQVNCWENGAHGLVENLLLSHFVGVPVYLTSILNRGEKLKWMFL